MNDAEDHQSRILWRPKAIAPGMWFSLVVIGVGLIVGGPFMIMGDPFTAIGNLSTFMGALPIITGITHLLIWSGDTCGQALARRARREADRIVVRVNLVLVSLLMSVAALIVSASVGGYLMFDRLTADRGAPAGAKAPVATQSPTASTGQSLAATSDINWQDPEAARAGLFDMCVRAVLTPAQSGTTGQAQDKYPRQTAEAFCACFVRDIFDQIDPIRLGEVAQAVPPDIQGAFALARDECWHFLR